MLLRRSVFVVWLCSSSSRTSERHGGANLTRKLPILMCICSPATRLALGCSRILELPSPLWPEKLARVPRPSSFDIALILGRLHIIDTQQDGYNGSRHRCQHLPSIHLTEVYQHRLRRPSNNRTSFLSSPLRLSLYHNVTGGPLHQRLTLRRL